MEMWARGNEKVSRSVSSPIRVPSHRTQARWVEGSGDRNEVQMMLWKAEISQEKPRLLGSAYNSVRSQALKSGQQGKARSDDMQDPAQYF